jgi:hypothetical protein
MLHYDPSRTTSLFIVLILLSPLIGHAQDTFGDYDAIGAAYHKFVLPGEASVTVLVLGSAGAGVYEVGRGTDLGRLLALTGASLIPAGAETRMKTTFRLFRQGATPGRREVAYDATLPDFLSSPDRYPQLMEGDVFVIETVSRPRFGWRDALSIFTTTAALTLTMERLGWL